MTIVSVYGQITEVQQNRGNADRFLLKNPDGTFIVLANRCRAALAANQLSPGDYVLVGGQLRSAVDNLNRGLTYIDPLYISDQATDLTAHLNTVLSMLLAGQQNNGCAACPQNCQGLGIGD